MRELWVTPNQLSKKAGMVAMEGGKSAPDSPFWNDFPDRIADLLILVGAGYTATSPALAILITSIRKIDHITGSNNNFLNTIRYQDIS